MEQSNQNPIFESSAEKVRLHIESERYEIAATLFQPSDSDEESLQEMSPDDELMLGVMSDDSESGYYVKPSDPSVLRAQATGEETDAIEKIELFSEGCMAKAPCSADDFTVTIRYNESELTGMAGALSTITWNASDPGLVTMLRSGTVNTALTFRAHHRAICTYETPYMPLHVGIHALVVDNRVETEGRLILDYIIEIRGARAERCRMVVTITHEDGEAVNTEAQA